MTRLQFDLVGLFQAVDGERRAQEMSWTALSRIVGVSASTIRRFRSADDAEADGVLALVRWLGATPEEFINRASTDATRIAGMPLPHAGGVVRVDMDLVAKADGKPNAGGRSRTTIQRLVDTAQRSGQPVASLTRITNM